MPLVHFTAHLRRVAPGGPVAVPGATLRKALEAAFAVHPGARLYVLDEQDRLRRHVAVFCRGERIQAESGLDLAVAADEDVFVLQALSGG